MPKTAHTAAASSVEMAAFPLILKASEVAALLRVNRKTLYEAVQREEVPGVIRVGRCLRFQRDAVLAWLGTNPDAIPTERHPG